MQDKYDIMRHLPTDTRKETLKNLSINDIMGIAATSTQHLKLFKPLADVRKLLNHLTGGDHAAVTAMLEQAILNNDLGLFYRKGEVTDNSGRIFENISGFEYALWALDKHMWTTIINCIPKNQHGNEVVRFLKGQYDNLDNNKITYSLDGQSITEKHFDFKNTILNALQTQVDLIKAPGPNNWETTDMQWKEKVGGAQRLLPMHVVAEYCSDKPFYPLPEFISQPESMRENQYWHNGDYVDWHSTDSKLGINFAVSKGEKGFAACSNSNNVRNAVLSRGNSAPIDLAALTALFDRRTLDFTNIKSQLEDLAILNNPSPSIA